MLESIEAVRPPQVPWPDDPDEPIDGEQFRVEVMRAVPSVAAFRGWLRSSRRAWAIGEQGYLPRPELADGRWRRGAAVRWQNSRPGPGRTRRREGGTTT